ncbi:unnamed protein product, partial [Tilletia caries]
CADGGETDVEPG